MGLQHRRARNGRDWSAEFVAITEALRVLPFRRIMLDGEAVSHCLDGLPDFHKLMSRDGQATACLYAFDLIWLEAQDLRGIELIGRRRMLQKALVRERLVYEAGAGEYETRVGSDRG